MKPETLSELAALINDDKVAPQERAQRLVDMATSAVKAAVEGPQQYWTETQLQWQKDIAGDREIGSGDPKSPLKAELFSRVGKALDMLGGQALRDALIFTGAGNHPAVVKAFVKLAPLITEDSTQPGAPGGAGPVSAADALYGHLRK